MNRLADRVRIEREELGWSQDRLAEEVTRRGFKIGQSAIGNIEADRVKDPKCIVQLAAALSVTPTWLQSGRGEKHPQPRAPRRARAGDEEATTPVAHYVGAGDEVHLFDDNSTLDEAPAPPGFEGQRGAAVIVRGDSMRPIFDPGDMLYFRSRRPPPVAAKDLPSRPVIVEVRGGRLYVKKLLPGTKRGSYHLLSINPLTLPLQDQVVENFAHIEWVKPRLA